MHYTTSYLDPHPTVAPTTSDKVQCPFFHIFCTLVLKRKRSDVSNVKDVKRKIIIIIKITHISVLCNHSRNVSSMDMEASL
jgi:hypothetical protein